VKYLPNKAMNTEQISHMPIRFFGVGNAGVAMLNRIMVHALPGATGVAVNTDEASLAASVATEKVCLEAAHLRGLGTGGDPERGSELAEKHFGRFKSLCEGAKVVFIFAGLGGGVGSGAAPVVARAAKESGALVFGFKALPFEFEGARRMRQAERSLEAMREVVDGVLYWPNQKVFKLISDNSSVAETLSAVNGHIADGVCGLWRLLTQRGLLDVQMADLCAALRDAHANAFFATVEAEGETRAAVAAEKLLAHPLVESGASLAGADAVLVGIAAGDKLAMAEVNRVMEMVNSHCGEAKVFVGAAEDASLGSRLVVTLVVAHRGEMPAEEVEPALAPRGRARSTAPQPGTDFDSEFLEKRAMPRPRSRFIALKPDLSEDQLENLARRQSAGATRGRKGGSKLRQSQLQLELVSKGRFEKSEPTIRDGQDLDVPTFVRRNMVFN
jgi:cell division protein FtsZ